MKNKPLEYSLVFVQFATLAYVVLSTSWKYMPVWSFIIIGLSGILAFWAIATMQLDNLKVTPSPGEDARLVTNGPYRLIRHPMYTSLLLFMLPLVVGEFSLLRLILGVLLLIDLVVKLNYEEHLLVKKFPQYGGYRHKTSRMVPFIY
jgi:protein-S-isoprenylcysteine O-methyltransferase Ste14